MIKKILGIAIPVLLAALLLIQLSPYGRKHVNPPVTSEPPWNNPQTRALAKRACFDCHSNETAWQWYSNIAPISWLVYNDVAERRRRLNFSDWNRSQGQYVDEFSEVYYERNMPPANYLLLHPAARLSEAEWKQFYDGLESIAAKYQP
ncbi:MAG TPA: heme-binding domain-containing protein [Anaerolineales bacterium]|nr:heme-binding domain-containing protein [Anaerolineales bacterium]